MFKSSPEPLLLEGGRAKKYHFEESRWSSDPWAAALLCPSVRRAPFTTPVRGRFIQHRACGALFAARTPAHCGSARSLARTGCLDPFGSQKPQEKIAGVGEANEAFRGSLWRWFTLQAAGGPSGPCQTQLQGFWQAYGTFWGVNGQDCSSDLHFWLHRCTKGCNVHTWPPGAFDPLLCAAMWS